MKPICILLLSLVLLSTSAWARQAPPDLYRCEGCDAIYEHSFDDLDVQTVIAAETEAGESLVLSGTVYQTDGTTPAPDVVVYAYHTNTGGIYPTRGDETGWARRHGYLRGWVKTDSQGRYRFRTIRPGTYPRRSTPAHVHMIVKEPQLPEYWIDQVVFEDDPFVTSAYRRQRRGRGGSGIIDLTRDKKDVWHGVRDITLEQHPEGR